MVLQIVKTATMVSYRRGIQAEAEVRTPGRSLLKTIEQAEEKSVCGSHRRSSLNAYSGLANYVPRLVKEFIVSEKIAKGMQVIGSSRVAEAIRYA